MAEYVPNKPQAGFVLFVTAKQQTSVAAPDDLDSKQEKYFFCINITHPVNRIR